MIAFDVKYRACSDRSTNGWCIVGVSVYLSDLYWSVHIWYKYTRASCVKGVQRVRKNKARILRHYCASRMRWIAMCAFPDSTNDNQPVPHGILVRRVSGTHARLKFYSYEVMDFVAAVKFSFLVAGAMLSWCALECPFSRQSIGLGWG